MLISLVYIGKTFMSQYVLAKPEASQALETQQEMLSMKAVFLQIHAASMDPQLAEERSWLTQAC